jgi:hypothetical protein
VAVRFRPRGVVHERPRSYLDGRDNERR